MVKTYTDNYSSTQLLKFAKQIKAEFGNGWQFLSESMKGKMASAFVASLFMGQVESTKFTCADLRETYQAIAYYLDLEE